MKNYTTKELNARAYEYILNCIDNTGYGDEKPLDTTVKQLNFLYSTFTAEYGYAVKRYGSQEKAFEQWIMGLPTCFGIEFTNYDILELAKSWGVITDKSTESYKDKIVSGYFNFITVKTFQLFRKHGIV